MTLLEKQQLFARLLATLIQRAEELGFHITMGETWRSPEEAKRLGHPESNHTRRLAVDLNLFDGTTYLTETQHHRKLGEWWEEQHPLCRWGGRFADGNHYSLEHEGRA